MRSERSIRNRRSIRHRPGPGSCRLRTSRQSGLSSDLPFRHQQRNADNPLPFSRAQRGSPWCFTSADPVCLREDLGISLWWRAPVQFLEVGPIVVAPRPGSDVPAAPGHVPRPTTRRAPRCSPFAHRRCAYCWTSQHTSVGNMQVRQTTTYTPGRDGTGWWGSNLGTLPLLAPSANHRIDTIAAT